MKTAINNMDIWRVADSLYCKRSDGHLIRIQSDRTDILVEILGNIRKHGRLIPPDDKDITPELFSEIARFLTDNQIIYEISEEGKIQTIGFFGPDDVFKDLPVLLRYKGSGQRFRKVTKSCNLIGVDLLLVMAPVFDNCKMLKELSDASYRAGIPLLYSAFSPTTFTIGPLCVPSLDTPSLSCYIKRRTVNLKSPGEYSEFIRSEDKELIETARITAFPYFETGMNMLRCETDRFLRHKGKLSYKLMGKSYTYDFTRFNVEESLVLKDPLSPLFAPHSPFTPFNG